MSDLIDVMAWKFAGYEYSCGETYESIEWRDERPKPSKEDIEIATVEYKEYVTATKYKALRRSAYPSIEDQLDTLFHEGLEGWKAVIMAIKEKYPK